MRVLSPNWLWHQLQSTVCNQRMMESTQARVLIMQSPGKTNLGWTGEHAERCCLNMEVKMPTSNNKT